MNGDISGNSGKAIVMGHLTKVARNTAPYLNNTACSLHGNDHLCHVAWLAGRLAKALDECIESAVVGGYLHDCGRVDDSCGNFHAHESAELARQILARFYTHLDIERIVDGIYNHADGLVTNDPLIACIWDADRISLTRLEVVVDLRLLSTKLARRLCRTIPRSG